MSVVGGSKCSHNLRQRGIRVEYSPGVESSRIDTNRKTGEPIRSVLVDAAQCLWCGKLQSVGPSADDSEAVRVEMRAAEISAAWKGRREPFSHRMPLEYGEVVGANKWPYRTPVTDDEWTGFLSVQMLNHDAEQAGNVFVGQHNADYAIANHRDEEQ